MTKQPAQFADRDLHTILRFPKLSWSSISSFQYDREEWYQKYVLGIRSAPNDAMLFGTYVGERLVSDPDFLTDVPRPPIYEQELEAIWHDIPLVGHLDGFGLKERILLEYKTSSSKTRWTAKSVHKHGQIDFYCLLIWLNYKIKPEDLWIRLAYIPVEMKYTVKKNGLTVGAMALSDEPVKIFPIKKRLAEVLQFGAEIKAIHEEMYAYIQKHK